MKKKILIIVGIFVLLIVVAMVYLNNRNRTLSPPDQTMLSFDGDTILINYSRPSVRDRLIFGEKEEGALQPYGVYWRLGANEPTDLTVTYDFLFGDTEMDAGQYVIYAIPGNNEMELRLNSDLRFWGYTEPDYSMDAATTEVPVQSADHTEQFTIKAEQDSLGARLIFSWDKYQWELPLQRQ